MNALHGLALNPALPAELLERLVAIADEELMRVLARRDEPLPAPPAVPDGYVLLVCGDEAIHPDVLVAEHPATSPVTLFRLTAHPESPVRLALASRRGLPVKAYQCPVNDPDPGVATAAAANPSLPVRVMEELLSSTT
jgi:hypothetical protein